MKYKEVSVSVNLKIYIPRVYFQILCYFFKVEKVQTFRLANCRKVVKVKVVKVKVIRAVQLYLVINQF